MTYTNMFNNSEKTLEGKVVVQLHENPMKLGTYYGKVTRSTADDAAIATEMVKHTDLVRFNDMTPVMSAFVSSVMSLLGQGNCVRISGLGTFYPKVAGVVNTPTPTVADLGTLKVGFTNASDLHLAVQDVDIAAIVDTDYSPVIGECTNMDSMEHDTCAFGKMFRITGKYLRLAGAESDNCGCYFVPKLGDTYNPDTTKWNRVDDNQVYTNKPGELLIRVPALLASGDYYVIIRTKAPSTAPLVYKDDGTGKMIVDPACLLKTARFGVSEKPFEQL